MDFKLVSIINPIKLETCLYYEIDCSHMNKEILEILNFVGFQNITFKIVVHTGNLFYDEIVSHGDIMFYVTRNKTNHYMYYDLLQKIYYYSDEHPEFDEHNPYFENMKKLLDYVIVVIKTCFEYANNETKKELNTIFYNDISGIILDYDIPYSINEDVDY